MITSSKDSSNSRSQSKPPRLPKASSSTWWLISAPFANDTGPGRERVGVKPCAGVALISRPVKVEEAKRRSSPDDPPIQGEAQQQHRDPIAGAGRVANPEWETDRRRGRVGTRGRLPALRHGKDLWQRRGRGRGDPKQRRSPRRDLGDDQIMAHGSAADSQSIRHEPRQTRYRVRRFVSRALAHARPRDANLESDGRT